MALFSDSAKKKKNFRLLDYLLHLEMRKLVNVLLVNCKLLPMAKSDLTLFEIPARYSPFSIIKIRYNI